MHKIDTLFIKLNVVCTGVIMNGQTEITEDV